MDLAAWLAYIGAETINSKHIGQGLDYIKFIAKKSGQLAVFQCPVITVAGTNGKGSCVAFLENILLSAGYRVGAYTSPHLLDYNERIRINGQNVSDEILCSSFEVINTTHINNTPNIPLSFFEFTSLAAFYIFQQAHLDCIILEVGVGGRLDAVNIIDPNIAVLTSISIDHKEWLGDTREKIGREKAGIMRSGRPAVCGDENTPDSIIQYAQEINSPLYIKSRDFDYKIHPPSGLSGHLPPQGGEGRQERKEEKRERGTWSWQSKINTFDNLPPICLPIQNASTALMVIELLQKYFRLDKAAVCQGLKQARLPGRFEQQGTTIFDVAHNPASSELLAKQLLAKPNALGKQIAVVGMLADKDIKQTLKPLAKWIDRWYIGSLDNARGAKAAVLAEALHSQGVVQTCYCFDSVENAYSEALASIDKQDRIIVFGSFYTVAAVKNAFF